MRNGKMKFALVVSAMAIALVGAASTVLAQVGNITVTAQRRAENLQSVPIAITAFTNELMDVRQINEALDIVQMIPNTVGFNNTGPATSNSYFIRGLGNVESIATFDPPVSTYVDDVYITRQNANNYALFDVERIEVLRGPQGTTFGRNTTGGAINIITRKPGEDFSAKAEAEYGRFDRFQISGSVDAPLTDQILTKISGFYVSDNGFIDNPVTGETLNDEKSRGIRGDIRFLGSDNVTWDVAVEHLNQTGTNMLTSLDAPRTSRTGISKEGDPGDLETLLTDGGGLGNETETLAAYSNLTWDINDSTTVELITGYRNLDQNFTLDFFNAPLPTGGFTIANVGNHEQFTQEVKINGAFEFGGVDIDYVAGVFYLKEDNDTDFTDIITNPNPTILISRILENDTRSVAGFAQFDFNLTDRLTVTGGARWTREKKNIDYVTRTDPTLFGVFNVGSSSGGVTTAGIAALGTPTEQIEKKWTPRAAVEFQVMDNILLYASATRGFKSGGWNARATSPTGILPFGPEVAWSYESGMKGDFLDNRLRVNANIFYSDIDGFQLVTGFPNPNDPSQVTFLTQNSAEYEALGIEAEITASPMDGLDLYAAFGFMDDKYENVTDIGMRITDDTEPVRTPDFTINLGGSYRYQMPDIGGDFIIGGEVSYLDGYQTSSTNITNSAEDGYWTMRARVGWESEDGRFGVFGECKNCTNSLFLNSFFIGPYYGEPARYSISVRARY